MSPHLVVTMGERQGRAAPWKSHRPEDDAVIGVGELEALARKTGSVRGKGIAAAGVKGGPGLTGGGKRNGLELQIVGAEVVGQILSSGRGALLRTQTAAPARPFFASVTLADFFTMNPWPS